MTELIIDQIPVPTKLSVKDLDFDALDDDELKMIHEEIAVVLKIRELKAERLDYVKKQIMEEKDQLRTQMLKELKREKDRILKEYKEKIEEQESDEDNETDETVESVIYNKKNPKGKVTTSKTKRAPAKKK